MSVSFQKKKEDQASLRTGTMFHTFSERSELPRVLNDTGRQGTVQTSAWCQNQSCTSRRRIRRYHLCRPQKSELGECVQIESLFCRRRAGFIHNLESMFSHQTQIRTGHEEESTAIFSSGSETRNSQHRHFTGIFATNHAGTHDKSTPYRLETRGIFERAVRRFSVGTSASMVQSGLSECWRREAVECFCHLWITQDNLADGRAAYERRVDAPFDLPIISIGAQLFSPSDLPTKVVHFIFLFCLRLHGIQWITTAQDSSETEKNIRISVPKP